MKGFKTYLGIALAVLGGLAGQLNVEAASDLPTWVDSAVLVVGGVLATYGRYDKERRAPEPKR